MRKLYYLALAVLGVIWSMEMSAATWQMSSNSPAGTNLQAIKGTNTLGVKVPQRAALSPDEEALAKKRAELAKSRAIIGQEWRVVNGVTNSINGDDGMLFNGNVISVADGGILVSGYLVSSIFGQTLFFVKDYPFQVTDGRQVRGTAFMSSQVYQYVTALGAVKTVVMLDYGRKCDPSVTVVQIKAIEGEVKSLEAKIAAVKKEELLKANTAKKLKTYTEKANAGDPFGEYQLGLMYLNGEGVEKDRGAAWKWFIKAADGGNRDAKEALQQLGLKP